jgi:membrane metallo-endopeptidase-like protein 1
VPQLNWLEYLSAFLDADIDHNEPVVSYAMPYFVEMGRIIQKTDRRLLFAVTKLLHFEE